MSASAESISATGSTATAQLFVINLAASTSPMALSHPTSPSLKRHTFFVSRQREDGRERFRLHMGYFSSQEEAEALLASVRDIYPAAWAGPAPITGVGRRGRIAAARVVAAPPVLQAAAPVPVVVAASPQRVVEVPPELDTMSNVRAVIAQLSESTPPAAGAPAVPVAPAAPVRAQSPAPRTAAAAPPAARSAAPAAPAARQVPPAKQAPSTKEVLSGAAELSLLESPVALAVAPAAPAVAAAPAVPAVPVARAATQQAKPQSPALPPLKNPFEGLEKEPDVRLVTPEDTQTLTDIKVDRENNAPPCFAVQLIWSTTPVDVTVLPHLAIFEAYTLYNVEGNRQGRRWFGLRLGFFSDPSSATQVANYVRSDYKNVAVVPVAVKERDRARGVNGAPSAIESQKTTSADLNREAMEGFELLSDDRPPPARRDLDDAMKAKAPARAPGAVPTQAPRLAPKANTPPATGSAPKSAGQSAGKPVGKRVVARRRAPVPPADRRVSAGVGGPEVLESTLEILGASTLSLDEGGRETITDAAARKPAAKKTEGGNRFSRLLSRLGGG